MKHESKALSKEDAIGELIKHLIPTSEIKQSLVADDDMMQKITNKVIESLISQGLIVDKLLTIEETMAILKYKSRPSLHRLSVDGKLQPIYPKKNSHPRYKLSDVNKYLKELKTVY